MRLFLLNVLAHATTVMAGVSVILSLLLVSDVFPAMRAEILFSSAIGWVTTFTLLIFVVILAPSKWHA